MRQTDGPARYDRTLSRLKLLLAKNRPLYRWTLFTVNIMRFLLRKPHEPDFAAFAKFPDRPGLFLDIGASIGQSALAFRVFNRRAPILSIEANASHEAELRLVRALLRGFDYMICAAGEATATGTLHLPVFRGLPLTGEASLQREAVMDPWWVRETVGSSEDEPIEVIEVPVTIRRLDDLRLEPAFVKIDVEGAEPQVLRGMTETIERHRPIFLIEDAGSHDEVSRFFNAHRYLPYEYAPGEDRLRPPVDGSANNLFYLPEEAAPS